MPKWRVAGLGTAYSIASWSAVSWHWVGLYLHPYFKSFKLFRPRWAADWTIIKSIWKKGSMIALLQVEDMATLSALAFLIGLIGAEDLAAYQVGMQFMTITMMPIIVMSQSLGILCSQYLGAKNMGNLRRIGHTGILMELAPPAIFITLAVITPIQKLLASIFIDNVNDPSNQTLISTTRNLMIILGIIAFPNALRFGFTGALRGFLDTQLAMLMGMSILALEIPLGLAAREVGLGAEGIIAASCFAIFVSTIPLGLRWFWKSHKTIEQIEAAQQKPSCFGLFDKVQSGANNLWNSASSFFGYGENVGVGNSGVEISEVSDLEIEDAMYQMS